MTESPYRWVIVAAGGVIGCVAIGCMFSLPVFIVPINEATGWSRTGISGAMTIAFIAMALGIWGGRVAAITANIVSADIYDKGLLESFIPYNVIFAMSKSYTFAFIITSIPAFYGYFVKGGALEIGRSSTKAVVVSCILILFADYVLSALLL